MTEINSAASDIVRIPLAEPAISDSVRLMHEFLMQIKPFPLNGAIECPLTASVTAMRLVMAGATGTGQGSYPRLAGMLLLLASLFPMAAAAATPPAAQTVNPPGVAWCEDYRPTAISEQERLRGRNLARLRAAQSELAPGFAPGTATTGQRLLAAYQEELGKARPSASVAASYLAQVSTVAITAARYQRVNALLCVSTTRALATKIETEAEAQRQQMAR